MRDLAWIKTSNEQRYNEAMARKEAADEARERDEAQQEARRAFRHFNPTASDEDVARWMSAQGFE